MSAVLSGGWVAVGRGWQEMGGRWEAAEQERRASGKLHGKGPGPSPSPQAPGAGASLPGVGVRGLPTPWSPLWCPPTSSPSGLQPLGQCQPLAAALRCTAGDAPRLSCRESSPWRGIVLRISLWPLVRPRPSGTSLGDTSQRHCSLRPCPSRPKPRGRRPPLLRPPEGQPRQV